MGMSNGRDTLTRIGFERRGDDADIFLYLDINPQDIQESHSARTYLQQTRTANTVQNFGSGVETFNISGHTGWLKGLGFDKALEMKSFFSNYLDEFTDNSAPSDQLIYHDYTNEQHLNVEIAPDGFSFTQDVSKPLLINYSIQLIATGSASVASTYDITKSTLGNTKSSLSENVDTTIQTNTSTYVNPKVSTSSSSVAYNSLGSQLQLGG